MEKNRFSYIDELYKNLEVNLVEVLESVNEFTKILESGEISFEQLDDMVNYDTQVLYEKLEKSKKILNIYAYVYDVLENDDTKLDERVLYFLNLIEARYSEYSNKSTVSNSIKSAKSKRLALDLIRGHQRMVDEANVEKFYEE